MVVEAKTKWGVAVMARGLKGHRMVRRMKVKKILKTTKANPTKNLKRPMHPRLAKKMVKKLKKLICRKS